MHLGGAITDTSKTSGIPSWKRGLLQMDNINFVDVIWFGTLACIKFIVSFTLLYLKIKTQAEILFLVFIRENLFEEKYILEAWPLFTFEIEFQTGQIISSRW